MDVWVGKMMVSILCMVDESIAEWLQESRRGRRGNVDFGAEGESGTQQEKMEALLSQLGASQYWASCHLLPLACSTH